MNIEKLTTYLERRNLADKFSQSERGELAIAKALLFIQSNKNIVMQMKFNNFLDNETVADIELLLALRYSPYIKDNATFDKKVNCKC